MYARRLAPLLLGLAPLCAPSLALANDSAAGLDGGNLVLKKAPGVRMQSEDLSISEKQVRVLYVFANTTTADVETIVAFPLPAFERESEGDRNFKADADNPLGFVVEVDGKRVPFQTERKIEGNQVRITHYWTQRFPAGQTVRVEHRYSPAATASFYGTYYEDDWRNKMYCIDGGTMKVLRRMTERQPNRLLDSREIGYILKTARNWDGPIGDFHLTLDKGSPGSVISLCIQGIRKTGPTRFELRKKDYVPDADLRILLLRPLPRG